MTEATPVSVITGFLGSGKTTLMRRLLRDPAMGRTAVIINEFGEIGIDHDLIESSDENFIELTTGCLCCKVRSDLVMTLRDMARRRTAGELPPFERVLIETSGLADPAAILQALMIDRDLAGLYMLGVVVTTVDSVLGLDTLARHRQSTRQVQVADRILLTKGDLALPAAGLLDRLERLNPGARRFQVQQGEIAASTLFDGEAGTAPARRAGFLRIDEALLEAAGLLVEAPSRLLALAGGGAHLKLLHTPIHGSAHVRCNAGGHPTAGHA